MIANNPMRPVCEYATDSQYKEAPNQEQLSCGVIPLDSLPAEWWNYLWGNANQQINNGVVALNNVIAEIINVMSAAGITPVSECTDQLKTAIQLLAQCIGTSTKAGAVKSSSTCGQVSISSTGVMTANGLGNATNLTTTNKGNVVAAINELKSQHEQQITDLESYVQGLQNSTVTGVKINSSGTVINPTSGIINLGLGSAAKCDISCFLSSDSLVAYAKQNGYFTGASDSWVCCANNSACLGGTLAACYALLTSTVACATNAGTATNATNLGGTAAACYALKTGTVANASNLGGTAAACYALKTGTVCYATRLGSSSGYYTKESLATALNGKAPNNHASSSTTYGVASATSYGHVKFQSFSCTSTNYITITCDVGSWDCNVYYDFTSTCPLVCLKLYSCNCSEYYPQNINLRNCSQYPLVIIKHTGEKKVVPIISIGSYVSLTSVGTEEDGDVCALVAPLEGVPRI